MSVSSFTNSPLVSPSPIILHLSHPSPSLSSMLFFFTIQSMHAFLHSASQPLDKQLLHGTGTSQKWRTSSPTIQNLLSDKITHVTSGTSQRNWLGVMCSMYNLIKIILTSTKILKMGL